MSFRAYWEESAWFWEEITERLKAGGNVIGVATGQPNAGKSFWCMELCEEEQRGSGLPKLPPEAIVFNAEQFWIRMETSEDGSWTLWDEPNKGLSHQDWYEEMNKAVTRYLQTFRFKHRNLVLALPHLRLLSKSARAVVLFEAMMKRPGLARVHQLEPDYYGNREFYKYYRGEVDLPLPRPSLVKEYETRKDAFHAEDFPKEEFVEKKLQNLSGWRRVRALVLETPDKYRYQGKLSARKISALLDCSDNTARKVITRIESEQPEIVGVPNTSASAAS